MARALFLSLPLSGHTNPTLPLVRELVARGEDVTYVTAAPYADAVQRMGARTALYAGDGLATLSTLPSRTEAMATWAMHTTARVLDANLDAFRRARPDYVITDSLAAWGQWVGRILAIPTVTSISTMALNRRVLAYGVARGVRPDSATRFLTKLRHMADAWQLHRGLERRYGVRGPGVMGSVMGSSDANIVYTSRYFQPCADWFDLRYHFVGPLIDRPEEDLSLPALRESTMPLVYVSLGTLFNAAPAFFRLCLDAFAGAPMQVVMSVGTEEAVAALGEPPPNVVVAPRVAQLAVLRHASAFVTHGGMNSVSESLSFGVPMVVVPQMGEQMLVGRRVEDLGAGLYLENSRTTSSRLRSLVTQVLGDPRFADAAEAVARSFEAAGGARRAADAVLAVARRTKNGVRAGASA